MAHFISRYQHLLWKLFPKRTKTIAGHKIKYVVVPKYLLIAGLEAKNRFSDAMCLIHRPTESLMILITSEKCCDLRYTLLHEYLEGMALLNFPVQGCDRAWANTAFENALTEVKKDVVDIEERIMAAVRRKKGSDREHFFALIVELALMKQELDHKVYKQELTYALCERF